MIIRIIFGYLFFFLSLIFCAVQLVTLLAAEHLKAVPLILQFFSTSVCLLLASLAAQSGHKTSTTTILVIALSVCFLALLIGGIIAITGTSETASIKSAIFFVYGGLYGLFGLAFSLLAGRPASNEVTKDA